MIGRPIKLSPDEISGLATAIDRIVRGRNRGNQRLVPFHEAQDIANTLDAIKTLAEEVAQAIDSGEPKGSIQSRLASIERQCNERLLSMHAHFLAGRKRKRLTPPIQKSAEN